MTDRRERETKTTEMPEQNKDNEQTMATGMNDGDASNGKVNDKVNNGTNDSVNEGVNEGTAQAQAEGEPTGEAEGKAQEEAEEKVEETEESVEELKERLAQLEAELAEERAKYQQLWDQMQRMAAEFQNTRKRQEQLLQANIERATEALILKLLPVLDDFEMAFQNIPEEQQAEAEAWLAGFRQIYRKLVSTLEEEGLRAIEREGEFNPELHQAISHEPSEEVESGHIIETVRTGYEHKERVLRPALVRVAQ